MLSLIVGLTLAASAANSDSGGVLLAADEKHTGKVVSAGDGKLLIVDDNGENQEFTVSAKTTIKRNGKEADLDDLQEGDVVEIKSQRKGKEFVAVEIKARSPE